MNRFYRIAACCTNSRPGDIRGNADRILKAFQSAAMQGASIVSTPLLAFSGCSCGDCFLNESLLETVRSELLKLLEKTAGFSEILLVGLPVHWNRGAVPATAVIQHGALKGLVIHGSAARRPFDVSGGDAMCRCISSQWYDVPVSFDDNMVFECENGLVFACAAWNEAMGIAAADSFAAAGTQIIFGELGNFETIGAEEKRAILARGISAAHSCVVAVAGAGMAESTSSGVYSGQLLIAQNGRLLADAPALKDETLCDNPVVCFAEINPRWIRPAIGELACRMPANRIRLDDIPDLKIDVLSGVSSADIHEYPFVDGWSGCGDNSRKVIRLQAAGLAKRVLHTHANRLVLGVSGGLDSTLALLVCDECRRMLNKPADFILAVTMPGMGTSDRTKNNAADMAVLLGAELRTVSIRKAVLQHFEDIGHDPENTNVVYENAQARERTQILMDMANAENGLVVGTGDMSEIALGWSTFNGDHMSMYCVNAGVPKTLIRIVISNFAGTCANEKLAAVLMDVVDTPVSPELLPGTQQTENILGSYDLHDFYLYYFLKYRETPENILQLACAVFAKRFSREEIQRTLRLFLKRFYTQQFKRNAAPEAPKILEISLDARTDWQMPADFVFDSSDIQ